MGSVAMKERRDEVRVEAHGGMARALALAARPLIGAWRNLVLVAGRQTFYLVGPSPWLVRDLGRDGTRDDGADGSSGGGATVPRAPTAGRAAAVVEVIRLKETGPRTLAGVR